MPNIFLEDFRAETLWLAGELKTVKSEHGMTRPHPPVFNPLWLKDSGGETRDLQLELQKIKSGSGAVATPDTRTLPPGSRYAGKPLPL